MGNTAYTTAPSFRSDGLPGIFMEEPVSKLTNVIDLNSDDERLYQMITDIEKRGCLQGL
jgi:hypothetical protein